MTRGEKKALAWSWAALAAGTTAWVVSHQVGSDYVIADCSAAGWWVIVPLGFVALILAGLGGFLSWRLWKREEEAESHRFIAFVGLAVGALLCFAILLQTIASLIIPRCFA